VTTLPPASRITRHMCESNACSTSLPIARQLKSNSITSQSLPLRSAMQTAVV
jgi:hypothetical protein